MVEVYERRISDLKAAHEATLAAMRLTIEALAEQVEFMRALAGRAQPTQLRETTPPPVRRGTPLHVSEEEEDVRGMFAGGHIDADELEHELRKLGIDLPE